MRNEKRGCRHFVLSNQLSCVTVSDSSSDKMAVSLNVPVGYFMDPEDFQGLTNLLEHSLLHGNPSCFTTFQKLLSEYDGSIQSMTLSERTFFCADASSIVFEEVLVGFARFFLEPSFSCTSSEAITNTHTIGSEKPSDLDQLQRHLTNEDHPYRKFNSGNWRLAHQSLKERDEDMPTFLRKCYESYYSTNLMSVIIYGSESLDHMEARTRKIFSGLRNSELKPSTLLKSLCTDDNFEILVKVPSMGGPQVLRVQWLVERSVLKPEDSDSIKYLLHVFNLNTEGSLFHILKHVKKWSPSAIAHETGSHSEFSFISLDIELTEEGMGYYKEICGLVFRYITYLKAFKPKKYIFDELHKLSMEHLSCDKVTDPIEYVAKIAANSLVGSVPLVYSENSIRTVQNALSVERVRIFLVSDEFQGQTNLVEPVCNIPYSIESLKGVIQDWIKNAPKVAMNLPGQKTAKKAVHNQICSTSVKPQHSPSLDTFEDNKDWIKNAPKDVMNQPGQKTAKTAVHNQICLTSGKTQYSASPYTLEDNKPSFLSQQTQHAVNVCIIFDQRMKSHKREGHQEQPERIQKIFDRLKSDGLLERCSVFGSEQAKLSQVILAHSDSHIRRIIKGQINKQSDSYFRSGSEDAIFLAAGGAIKAATMVANGDFEHGFAVVRPPGHHAASNFDHGFCYFNNIAIAAKHLQKENMSKKILILDFDIHFGDGTAQIFEEDDSVLYISMHLGPDFFPFGSNLYESRIGKDNGTGYSCNVLWGGAINDDDFMAVLEYLVVPMAKDFNPDIVLVSAGFDAAINDVANCYVTPAGYASVIHKLLQLKKPLVLVLEGGYTLDILAECCSACVQVLTGDTSKVKDTKEYVPLKTSWDSIIELRKSLQPYHNSLGADIPAEVLSRWVYAHPKPRIREVT